MTTQYYLGAAITIPEVAVYVVAGTWATADTLYFEINGKRLTLTVGATSTIAQIVADVVDMINGEAANGTETRSALGSAVGEFAELTASNSSPNVVITGKSDGRPIGTITVGETTAGDGTIAVVGGSAVAAVSPYHFSAGSNWSSGSVPADNDDIVFDHQAAASCLYGLSPSSLTPTSVTVTKGFRHSIGLPAVNTNVSSYPFDEHLDTYLTLDGGGTVTIDAASAQAIKLNVGAVSTAIIVTGTGTTSESNVPPLLLKANHAASTLTVAGGSVGLNFEPTVAGEVATVFVGGQGSPSLNIGNATTVATINVASGSVVSSSIPTTLIVTGGSYEQKGAGTITTATVDGTLYLAGTTTITTLALGGILDATRDVRARTITTCGVYAKASLKDPQGTITFTNGIDMYCKLQDVNLDLPARRTYAISAI